MQSNNSKATAEMIYENGCKSVVFMAFYGQRSCYKIIAHSIDSQSFSFVINTMTAVGLLCQGRAPLLRALTAGGVSKTSKFTSHNLYIHSISVGSD